MSTLAFEPMVQPVADPPDTRPTVSTRLASLDIFRGITIAMMLLVNNPGSGHTYDSLEHAPWNGWTPTDLVFPFFVFIMGVAMPFSMAKRSAIESKGEQFLHILARGLSLFLLGELGYSIPSVWSPSPSVMLNTMRTVCFVFLVLGTIALLYPWKMRSRALLAPVIVGAIFLALWWTMHFVNQHALKAGWVGATTDLGNGLLNPDVLRIPGVLQRLGVCYIAAASLALVIGPWALMTLVMIVLLAGYSLLMLKVPYPSLVHPGVMVHGLLDQPDNFARHIDVVVFRRHVYGEYPDPEGLISTIPAIVTALLGVLAGRWLRTIRPAAERCAGLFTLGMLVVCIGAILDSTLMPINKRLWTPSYAVFTAGLAMLGLGTIFYLADVLGYRKWAFPFKVYGMNAIAAFVLSSWVGRMLSHFKIHDPRNGKLESIRAFLGDRLGEIGSHVHLGSTANNASLAYALAYVLFFLLVMLLFYALKIFLKV